jgi:hypothetical protein
MLRQLLSANLALSYSPGEEGVGNFIFRFYDVAKPWHREICIICPDR